MIDFKSVMSSFDILGIKPDIWSIPVLSLISNLKIRYRLEVGPHKEFTSACSFFL